MQAARGDLQPDDECDPEGNAPSGPVDAAKAAPTTPSRATVLLGEAIEEGNLWLVEAALAAGADKEARDKVMLPGGGHGVMECVFCVDGRQWGPSHACGE